MKYTWKESCENKDDETAQNELDKIVDFVSNDEDFEECENNDNVCDTLECIQRIREGKAFGDKRPSEFCNNDPLVEEKWDDIPLDDIFLQKAGDATYCFTREDLEGMRGSSKNPYTNHDINIDELLSQRVENVLYYESGEDDEEELSLDAQLSFGLASSFSELPSYRSISSTEFKKLFPTKLDLIYIILRLLKVKISAREHPFRSRITVDAYPTLNTVPELWAQFGNDVATIPAEFQPLFYDILLNNAGNPDDKPEEWVDFTNVLLIGIEYGEIDDSQVLELIYPDGSSHLQLYINHIKRTDRFIRPNSMFERIVKYRADDGSKQTDILYGDADNKIFEKMYRRDGSKEKDIKYRQDGMILESEKFYNPDGSIHKISQYNELGIQESLTYYENGAIVIVVDY